LVKGVLKHFKSSVITGTKELGELWDDVEKAAAKPLEGRTYNRPQKKKDVETALGTFNTAFGKLFQDSNPDNIHKFAQPILDHFGHNIEFKLRYTQADHENSPDLDRIVRNHVRITVKYLGKEVEKPHIFLNFEIPVKVEHKTDSHIQNFIDKAEDYFNLGDNKAAGVYLRSAFEFILKRTCMKRSIPVAFRLSVSDLTTEHLWIGLKKFEVNLTPAKKKLTTGTINDIEHYRKLVLNPLSHHDVNKHEITTEIQNAINTIKTLKNELSV